MAALLRLEALNGRADSREKPKSAGDVRLCGSPHWARRGHVWPGTERSPSPAVQAAVMVKMSRRCSGGCGDGPSRGE